MTSSKKLLGALLCGTLSVAAHAAHQHAHGETVAPAL